MEGNSKVGFLKDLIGFSISSWVSAILSFFSTPLITRAFLPEELGKIHLFITFVNLFLNFSYLGIDQAFTRFYHEPPGKNDKKSLLTLCIMLTCIFMAIVTIGVLILHNVISQSIIGYCGFVIPTALLVSVISQVFMRFFNLASRMEKNILLFNIQAIISTVISNVSYVAVALYSSTAENAIIFRTALTFIATVVFFVIATKNSISMKVDYSNNVVKTILQYALPVCPAAILAVANNSIGQIIMKNFVDYTGVGIYSNAATVASIITIIQTGFASYWSPFVYENYKTQQNRVIQVHHLISFVMILFALVIFVFQDLIYLVLVGKMYWASKQIFPLLVISPVCYTVAETLGIGIRLSRKTYLNIPPAIVNIVINIILCYLLIPNIGIIGGAIAAALSSIFMLIVRAYYGEREYRCSDNYKKIVIALVVLILTAVIHVFIYDLLMKYIVYGISIVLVCIVYKNQAKMMMEFAVQILKNIIHRNVQ